MKDQSLESGFAILSSAGIAVKVLSLLYIPFLRIIIGDEGYGIYSAAYQIYVFVYVLANSGIPVAISKLVSELVAVDNYRDALKSFKIARFILIIIGIVMTIAMLLLALPASRLFHFEKSYLAIMALAPALLFTSVASAYRGYFQGRGNMKPTALSQILEQVMNTIFTLLFAALFTRFGVEAACAGGTLGTLFGAFCSASLLVLIYRKRKNYLIPKNSVNQGVDKYSSRKLAKKIVNYSIPITLCIGLQYAGNLVDMANTKTRLLVAGFSDIDANSMYGFLNQYQALLNTPISIVAALSATILPAISAAIVLKNRPLVQSSINFAFRLCFIITIPSAVGLSILSDPIYRLLQFGPAYELMFYGSISLILLAIVQIQTSILQGSGMLYTVTFNLILGIIGKIVTNYFLISIPSINVYGAIIGSVFGYCIPIILNMLTIKKHIRIKQNLFTLAIKPTIASAAMGVLAYVTYTSLRFILSFISIGYLNNAIAVITAILIAIPTYFIIMVLLKGIGKRDLDTLPAGLKRRIPGRVQRMIH
jgi:stage V sporulation protein B